MSNYIDGFAHPIHRKHLNTYKVAATEVAKIWKEHGALAYFEYLGDDQKLAGTLAFSECLKAKEDEVILFGWVVFSCRESRDLVSKKVADDARMADLVAPLVDSSKLIFDAKRMAFGGFEPFIVSE